MIRWLVLAPFALILFLENSATANVSNAIGPVFPPGYRATYIYDSAAPHKWTTFVVELPSNTIGIIGMRRISGLGDLNLRIGKEVLSYTKTRVQLGGVIAEDTSTDEAPDLLIIPPSTNHMRYYLEIWPYTHVPGTWVIRHENFYIPGQIASAFGLSLLQYTIQCSLTNCDEPPSRTDENIGRAVNLGMSMITQSNVCAIGADVALNEIQIAAEREFPNNRFMLMFIRTFASNFISKTTEVMCQQSP